MGVAVIVIRWGISPSVREFSRRSRCSTPNFCCSSTAMNPKSWYSTSLDRRAWVPMMICEVPSAMVFFASRFWAAFMLPENRVTSMSWPVFSLSLLVTLRVDSYSWRASTSVGASMTACFPAPTARIAVICATTVFPAPTSALSRVEDGVVDSIFRFILTRAFFCPLVRSNGSALMASAWSPPLPPVMVTARLLALDSWLKRISSCM